MSISLQDLCNKLPNELIPVGSSLKSNPPISAVHISELTDPTPFLDGGELLLTLGLSLPSNPKQPSELQAWNDYFTQLKAGGIVCVGLGLSSRITRVPAEIIALSEDIGTELVTIPDPVPFLRITREFWRLRSQGGVAHLLSAIGAQADFARLTARDDGLQGLIRSLAQTLQCWVAYLPLCFGDRVYWPEHAASTVNRVEREIGSYAKSLSTLHSAATFELGDSKIFLFPVFANDIPSGYIVLGLRRQLTAPERRIVHTLASLISLKAGHSSYVASTQTAIGNVIAELILNGDSATAQRVAQKFSLKPIANEVYLVARRSRESGANSEPEPLRKKVDEYFDYPQTSFLLQANIDGTDFVIVPDEERSTPDVNSRADPRLSIDATEPYEDLVVDGDIIIAGPVPILDVTRRVPEIKFATVHAGSNVGDAVPRTPVAVFIGYLRRLHHHPNSELTKTVISYLRHRGRWEEVAKELGVHRNTVRNRILTAQEFLCIDLDDPDTSAWMWIAATSIALPH